MNARLAVPVAARALAVVFALVAPGIARAQTPSFTMVGYAPGAGASRIYGLSADGRSAAGFSAFPTTVSTPYPGFVWSASAGRNDFGLEAGTPLGTWSLGISGDGHTAVGYSWATQGGATTAFRWSGTGTFQSLGTMGWTNSRATGASNDGSTVVGYLSTQSGNAQQAFRWTPGAGMQTLGPLFSEANAISRDGSTIVGETAVTSGAPQAFRWTQAGGVQALAGLNGSTSSDAWAVSGDGSYIVGLTVTSTSTTSTIWRNGVPADLGLPVGWHQTSPLAVSDDGQVVVGTYVGSQSYGAAIWTTTTGFMPLADYLEGFGVVLPANIILESCTSVSADGKTFAGWTHGTTAEPGLTQGFVATIPAPGWLATLLGSAVFAARRRRSRSAM
jgi:probable HAF family extracellular repeat protein